MQLLRCIYLLWIIIKDIYIYVYYKLLQKAYIFIIWIHTIITKSTYIFIKIITKNAYIYWEMRIVPKPRIRSRGVSKGRKKWFRTSSRKRKSWQTLQAETRMDDRSRRNFGEWSRGRSQCLSSDRSKFLPPSPPPPQVLFTKFLPTRHVMHHHRLNRERLADVEAERATILIERKTFVPRGPSPYNFFVAAHASRIDDRY